MQHDLQDINERQKKFFKIPEADTEYSRSVTLFEGSNVPKTDVVPSVIATETLPPTFHAADEVVIRSPHDPEVPSSNPGKNNTSDFSIRDPLSLPSCDWYRIYLAMWWHSSVGRAADLIYTCQVRCHGFDSRCFPHI